MSKLVDQRVVMIPTEMGVFAIHYDLVTEYDVEDIIQTKTLAQAIKIHMQNIGDQLIANPNYPEGIIPSAFKSGEA